MNGICEHGPKKRCIAFPRVPHPGANCKNGSNRRLKDKPKRQRPTGAADEHAPNFGEQISHVADFARSRTIIYRMPFTPRKDFTVHDLGRTRNAGWKNPMFIVIQSCAGHKFRQYPTEFASYRPCPQILRRRYQGCQCKCSRCSADMFGADIQSAESAPNADNESGLENVNADLAGGLHRRRFRLRF